MKDETAINSYELTLTPNYVSDWTFNDALKYIRLERDRKTCDSWNVEEITSLMIAEAMVKGDIPIEQVRKMIEERADDVYHFEFNTYKNDVKKVQENADRIIRYTKPAAILCAGRFAGGYKKS